VFFYTIPTREPNSIPLLLHILSSCCAGMLPGKRAQTDLCSP
jgi:hypothetical protein